jgi:hypothetical protein
VFSMQAERADDRIVFIECGVSITCEVSREPGVEWFLTKESGRVPPLCAGLEGLLRGFSGLLDARGRRSIFAVKVEGGSDRVEALVVPSLSTTVDWFEDRILPTLSQHVQEGSWAAVVHICHFLVCKAACLRACSGECTCEERVVWRQGGWRRVPVPEMHLPTLPFWWSGVTDAFGAISDDSIAWLRCPCAVETG